MAVVITLLLGACAQTPMQPSSTAMRPPPADIPRIDPDGQVEPEGLPEEADRMADVPGDQKLQSLTGKVEQIDCKTGVEDLQARMAIEARGGQVASFAFYSKRKPRTCSLDVNRNTPYVKWRQTADGATRVQTLHGPILIRTLRDGYEFEFQNVARQKICGMEGYLNGTMTIKRKGSKPECSVAGLLDSRGSAQRTAELR
jgi:hypothetical protein